MSARQDQPAHHFRVLGMRLDTVQTPDVVAQLAEWTARHDRCRYVAVTGMHGVMEAQGDAEFRAILNEADLVVPDGMPLVWLGRLRGHNLKRRVYGPELMLTFLQQTGGAYRHFFYGGAPGVPEQLAERLRLKVPALKVVGTFSPPYRALTEEEDAEIARQINDAAPDVVWVGLGTPKQERWM
ncbi:MAG: WecB/TagA/CpsF family glycosyltransferase, partial [Verrucomicrobiales bacterium]|nr:WecB/TagA/CpsF family glycosyltransferase [Verrucomicrobiales bacterium]